MNYESDGNNVVHNIIKCYIMVVFSFIGPFGPAALKSHVNPYVRNDLIEL